MKIYNSWAMAVHPLVFETGVDETPHSIAGTGFLIGYSGRVFFVTARHALKPDAIYPLCILSPSGYVLPLKDVYFVPITASDEDFADLAIVEIDMQRVDMEHYETRVISLESVTGDWQKNAQSSSFFVLGFPKQYSWVDYEIGEVQMGFVELTGSYQGIGKTECLHELKVEKPSMLDDFSGFSGGPVFCRQLAADGGQLVLLCGVAVQGTIESRIIYFIETSIIQVMLKLKCARDPLIESKILNKKPD